MKNDWSGGWYAWKHKWHEMNPEDRAKMKAQWKERCATWRTNPPRPEDIFPKENEAGTKDAGVA